jgi:hypothetical protein
MTSRTLMIRRLSAGTIYKLFAVGFALSVAPFGLLMGVLALLGSDTVTWNGAYVHGLGGLLAGALIGALLSAVLTGLLGTASFVGLWLYSKFETTEITFVAADNEHAEVDGHPTAERAA